MTEPRRRETPPDEPGLWYLCEGQEAFAAVIATKVAGGLILAYGVTGGRPGWNNITFEPPPRNCSWYGPFPVPSLPPSEEPTR